MEKREPVLSMRDLAVSFQASFGKIRAVRGVNMDVYPGETVAIVGESGSEICFCKDNYGNYSAKCSH